MDVEVPGSEAASDGHDEVSEGDEDDDADDRVKILVRGAVQRRERSLPNELIGLQSSLVAPGDEIAVERGYVRGHGTLVDDGVLIATVAGAVERVNKLVAVRPLVSRYTPEIGDVVVGRVVEVAQKSWRVDINARQNALLMLSAVNLPGGVQRRRTYEDELNMRDLISEDDLISAEVQELRQDGSIALHTRSLKYGKLGEGQLVRVQSSLMRRQKKHFHRLPCDVHVILGNNGFVWISAQDPGQVSGRGDDDDDGLVDDDVDMGEEVGRKATAPSSETGVETSRRITRVRNALVALNRAFVSIHTQTIMDVYEAVEREGVSLSDMLRPKTMERLTATARARRTI